MDEIKMSPEALIRALERMAGETGSLNCLGCGHEHSCSTHGCAVLKAAADMIRAAVGDLKYIAFCGTCVHYQRGPDEEPCGSCHGGDCFVWQGASGRMGQGDWIPVAERMPEDEQPVLAVVSGQPEKNILFDHAIELAKFSRVEGWILEILPEWENPKVSHWIPVPELPKEE